MKVGIIGCGVIGGALLRACIAKGIDVRPYDKYKAGMNDVVHHMDALAADLIFLCLPTPTVMGIQDISALEDALKELDKVSYAGPIVIRSTVLPGTTNQLGEQYPKLSLTHCPEFLTAASPFEDLIKQTAVMIGGGAGHCLEAVRQFWLLFDKKTPCYVFGDSVNTEMAKYIHNCFLATKVSFFNDIYELCNAVGANFYFARDAALAVGQIGKGHTAVPGPDGEQGYGGMCFPKDMNALLDLCTKLNIMAETIAGAAAGNGRRRSKPEDK